MTESTYRWAFRLGILSLIAILAAHLALTDIRHGEADLTLEWNVLRMSFLIILAFHVTALRALRQANRSRDRATSVPT